MGKSFRVRCGFYLIGILCLSFGISCSINSQLGAAPVPSLQAGLQQTVGLTVGSWELIIGTVLVTIIAIVRRSRPDVLAFLSSFLTGLSIDMWLYLSKQVFIPDQLMGKLLFLCLGLLFIGLGVSTYLQAKFSPAPPDGMILLLEEIWRLKRSVSRTVFSLIVLIFAFFFHGPIGFGTFIMVVSMGPVVALFYPFMEALFNRLNDRYPKNIKGITM